MFTTPCCQQTFQTHGHRCGCGHYWDRQRMIQHNLIDDMFQFEAAVDIAEGNFGGALLAMEEEAIFDGGFGF